MLQVLTHQLQEPAFVLYSHTHNNAVASPSESAAYAGVNGTLLHISAGCGGNTAAYTQAA
ncbi:hypothetical protein ACFVRB_11315 [Streptomyces nojiriensis]|uniref:hypothetical protein n=1 Tax=Streptomyces nojiriensis TaxID=66374 RepID=UPI0036DA3C83